ncbi:metallophosphoesterase [Chondrinema litorale]|uniref:metallophosphoesterase n=1 Tax=Chondrinema litorale TaxID=2994555 RepID=UPI002543B9ED|nr:metallophosphoesterase [Chondrinema litorale]UZR96110.1 metallophosphoesterase [Chondrinema litorale]
MPASFYTPPEIKIDSNSSQEIYVIGDVHGCFYTLKKLIEESLKPTENDLIIFLGDLINRGNHSKKVLDYIIHLQEQSYSVKLIRGNHEHKFLMAYGCGFEYFESFLESYNSLDLLDENLETYLELCSKMEYCIYVNDYLLSHIGFLDNNSFRTPANDTRSLFSDVEFPENIYEKNQITGHFTQSVKEIEKSMQTQSSKFSIDGGCVYKKEKYFGNLCAFELISQQLIVQKNIDE